MASGLGLWVHLSMSKKQLESASSMLPDTWVSDCQRGQIIHLRVTIAPNWMFYWYRDQMKHVITILWYELWVGWSKWGKIILILRFSYYHLIGQGHLEAVLHIMGYLKHRHNSSLAFDLLYPDIDHRNFWDCDSTDFYEGAVKVMLPNTPPPRGKEVDLCIYIDIDDAGDKQTRKSTTGFMICMSILLTIWYSERQSTIETLGFGSEFVAIKVWIKTSHAIR